MTSSSLRMIAVLGLGRSGRAACLRAAQQGISYVAYDDKLAQKAELDVQGICLTPPADWAWDKLDALVISPGIPHHHPAPHPAAKQAQDAGIPVISEIEFALRTGLTGRLVTVTGTNGKSTITALIGHILADAGYEVAIGGNLGEPLCELPALSQTGIYVAELSSYQLETTPSLSCDCTVISNITPDHLDRHGGFDGYVKAKKNALLSVKAGGLACLGTGPILEEFAQALAPDITCLRLDISQQNALDKAVLDNIQNPALSGPHNAENCLAAIFVCRYFGLSDAVIYDAITRFSGLPHRMQPAGTSGTVSFINDSKATNAEAAARALRSFESIWWCAGGLAKDAGLTACLPHLAAVRGAFLYGASANDFARQLDGLVPVSLNETLDEAVGAAVASARSDVSSDTHTILLSPAAASFDQYDSFEARGDAFCARAKQLIASGISEPSGKAVPHA